MVCFEDNLPVQSALDRKMVNTIFQRPNVDKLRKTFLTKGTSVGNSQAAARTVLWYAAETDLRTIIALLESVDLDDVADIELCHRTRMLDIDALFQQRYKNVIRGAIDEVRAIIGETALRPIEEYLASDSPVYRVSAAACLVLCAVDAIQLPELPHVRQVEPPPTPLVPDADENQWYFNETAYYIGEY